MKKTISFLAVLAAVSPENSANPRILNNVSIEEIKKELKVG
ncbi:MAG TPA: hypothetical protein VFD16_00550 [Candidatus Saccharimonadales bacterium]|nr:hypothetical protein [Candidatus Saccharimonadales bacterium]